LGNYFGSKATSGLYQAIISIMPPHATYIETHLGGGAIMKRKPPSLTSIGIDIDPRPINEFECSYPVDLINGCAHDFLRRYAYTGSELIYSDPPYLASTRTSDRTYRFEYTDELHIELLELLKTLPCHIILSGYPSLLYEKLLPDWNTIELQVMNQGGVRTEKLWFNFVVDRVHWARFAGKNFTDRQRIKRKVERWQRKYTAMPHAERVAIMAALMEVESQTVNERR
jgi:site-specific DNA-adenine methylase